ncbi:hypothetical protein [Paraburkholderia sp. J12]|uniref:hypothetical protein n=1 Tax=Paraburkholderia sp. J12 TaxID=2805432 RepID=UPI002ABD38FA|nr:hypothetical protein [Paraburkholderia sp. J12]
MKSSASRSATLHRRKSPSFSKRLVLWAKEPFVGRFGRYIGIALESHRLSVAIYTPTGPRWVSAALVLDSVEAHAWASYGFRRA